MRILYIDIDSLRPDHLGCYGYHRQTSPNIDRIARQGVRFDNLYASDMPCAPSRTALFSGRFGIQTGLVCHAGTPAEPAREGRSRGFQDVFSRTSWPAALRQAGYRAASVSSFGQRHSAWWWYAGLHEVIDCGGDGNESAERVTPEAVSWLERRGREDRWFLHVNFWDAHTPYRAPASFGEPFAGDPLPAWLTDDLRGRHFRLGVGPQGARERGHMLGIDEHEGRYPRQPFRIDSMQQVRRMFDGYDTAVRYVDEQIGRLLAVLEDQGVLEETAILISADHGENLGETNIYGCHQTADQATARVPGILRWPGVTDRASSRPGATGRVEAGLCYHVDLAATLIELAGGAVPDNWSGRSLARPLAEGQPCGRDHLVISQMQGVCQRAVRFNADGRAFLFQRTWHDGLHDLPERRLFDLGDDPHQLVDLAARLPEACRHAEGLLEQWTREQLAMSGRADPLHTVLAEGGPPHSRRWLPRYLERLRETGRSEQADRLLARHGARG